ncbi:MAG TPA: SRPBCC domain-containing protein [Gammaproteobacteria bacterium]|nr:SRPBCC domain-containing protein [Gammaproteobacteria bacterium]
MADILHLIKIRAPREKVYQALTTAEGVRNWWTRDTDLDSKVGGKGEFRFAKGTRVTTVSIEELKPASRVVWKAISAPIPTWADTRIEFELHAEGDATLLAFAHRGFPEADDMFAYSNTAWAQFILSLHEYLETGKGTPHPDDPISRPANS